jgi:hypothetical protein
MNQRSSQAKPSTIKPVLPFKNVLPEKDFQAKVISICYE